MLDAADGYAAPRSSLPTTPDGEAAPDTATAPDVAETTPAVRRWWDEQADTYQAEHGAFLGDSRFIWGPEGVNETDTRLLGDITGRRVLEIGCGAGQCGRWLAAQRAQVVGVDLSHGQLRHSRRLDDTTGTALPVVQADAQRLPFPSETFDLAFSAYGALPFVADATATLSEIARVLRPGGRLVFSTTHPIRWSFLDDPTERGLIAVHSYFDRTPYLEHDEHGEPIYAEYHRTLGDWVRALVAADLSLVDLVEPEWPATNDQAWDGWSPLRGRIIPGTAIFICVRP